MTVSELKQYTAADFVRSRDLQNELFALTDLLGMHYLRRGCGDCVGRALAKLHRLTADQINQLDNKMQDNKTTIYKMKRGIKYRPPGWAFVLSETNATDELIRKAIERNPSCAGYFYQVPVQPLPAPVEVSQVEAEPVAALDEKPEPSPSYSEEIGQVVAPEPKPRSRKKADK